VWHTNQSDTRLLAAVFCQSVNLIAKTLIAKLCKTIFRRECQPSPTQLWPVELLTTKVGLVTDRLTPPKSSSSSSFATCSHSSARLNSHGSSTILLCSTTISFFDVVAAGGVPILLLPFLPLPVDGGDTASIAYFALFASCEVKPWWDARRGVV
jgi:hypothetical protein